MRRSLVHTKSQKLLELRASVHRFHLTPSEQELWGEIRGCRLGVWFRRQACVGRYIADFLAPSAWLVVEVDGGYHALRRSADARRDRALQRSGYRVLRLNAELVQNDIAQALLLVRAALAEVR